MNTAYKPQISPFQAVGRKAIISPQYKNNSVEDAIRKNLGSYSLTATFEEDTRTLQTLKNIPGVVAFLCTLKNGSQVLSEGRGMALVNKMNKFFERSIGVAKGSALLDAVAKSTKILDVLHFSQNQQDKVEIGDAYKATVIEDEKMSDRQREYLSQLISLNIEDSDERERWMSQMETMSKFDASEAIQSLLPDRE